MTDKCNYPDCCCPIDKVPGEECLLGLKEQNEAATTTQADAVGLSAVERFVMFFNKVNCWLNGHSFEGGIDSDPVCKCGALFEYDAAINEGARKNVKIWFSRKFGKCVDCGKRFGDHSDCLPF